MLMGLAERSPSGLVKGMSRKCKPNNDLSNEVFILFFL